MTYDIEPRPQELGGGYTVTVWDRPDLEGRQILAQAVFPAGPEGDAAAWAEAQDWGEAETD